MWENVTVYKIGFGGRRFSRRFAQSDLECPSIIRRGTPRPDSARARERSHAA